MLINATDRSQFLPGNRAKQQVYHRCTWCPVGASSHPSVTCTWCRRSCARLLNSPHRWRRGALTCLLETEKSSEVFILLQNMDGMNGTSPWYPPPSHPLSGSQSCSEPELPGWVKVRLARLFTKKKITMSDNHDDYIWWILVHFVQKHPGKKCFKLW